MVKLMNSVDRSGIRNRVTNSGASGLRKSGPINTAAAASSLAPKGTGSDVKLRQSVSAIMASTASSLSPKGTGSDVKLRQSGSANTVSPSVPGADTNLQQSSNPGLDDLLQIIELCQKNKDKLGARAWVECKNFLVKTFGLSDVETSSIWSLNSPKTDSLIDKLREASPASDNENLNKAFFYCGHLLLSSDNLVSENCENPVFCTAMLRIPSRFDQDLPSVKIKGMMGMTTEKKVTYQFPTHLKVQNFKHASVDAQLACLLEPSVTPPMRQQFYAQIELPENQDLCQRLLVDDTISMEEKSEIFIHLDSLNAEDSSQLESKKALKKEFVAVLCQSNEELPQDVLRPLLKGILIGRDGSSTRQISKTVLNQFFSVEKDESFQSLFGDYCIDKLCEIARADYLTQNDSEIMNELCTRDDVITMAVKHDASILEKPIIFDAFKSLPLSSKNEVPLRSPQFLPKFIEAGVSLSDPPALTHFKSLDLKKKEVCLKLALQNEPDFLTTIFNNLDPKEKEVCLKLALQNQPDLLTTMAIQDRSHFLDFITDLIGEYGNVNVDVDPDNFIFFVTLALENNTRFGVQALDRLWGCLAFETDKFCEFLQATPLGDLQFLQLVDLLNKRHRVGPEIYKALISVNGLALRCVPEQTLESHPDLILDAMNNYPEAVFQLGTSGLSIRSVQEGFSASSIGKPVPVTLQPRYIADEPSVPAATFRSFVNPETDNTRILVYDGAMSLVSAKKDIGSDIIRFLPKNLTSSYSLFSKKDMPVTRQIRCYTLYYTAAMTPDIMTILPDKFFRGVVSAEKFEDFLTFAEDLLLKNEDFQSAFDKNLKMFRSDKQMSAKLKEKAYQLQHNIKGSSKHLLHHLFKDNEEFNQIKAQLSQDANAKAKNDLLLFLCRNKNSIPDFSHVLHKLFNRKPHEILDYLKKGSIEQQEELEMKSRLNETILASGQKSNGETYLAHSLDSLKSDFDGGKTLYTPPTCFGMRIAERSHLQTLVDFWKNCNSVESSNLPDERIVQLNEMMRDAFDHVMPSLVGLTKNLSEEKSEAIWQAVGNHIKSTYTHTVQKEQIAHYLLCQLIIENHTETFKANYKQLRTSLDCDWDRVERQFFQISVGLGGEIMPGKQLAKESKNKYALNFFERDSST